MEDAPQRVVYTSDASTATEEEEAIDKIVVVVLSVFFILIIMCCIYELYRTDKAYKRRKEFETDANILWSKEQAAKMQETPFVQVLPIYKNNKNNVNMMFWQVPPETVIKPPTQNGKLPNENTNGTTNKDNEVVVTTAEVAPIPEEVPTKPIKRQDSKRDKSKRISFRGKLKIQDESIERRLIQF